MRYERPDTPERARAKSLLWNGLALLFGWTLFVYWWWIVLRRTERGVVWHLVTGLAILASFLVFFTLVWILHNLRLAGRSGRNRATRYHPGAFERDKLDRPVVLGDLHVLREASVIVVQSADGQKVYRRGDSRDLA